MRHCRIVSASIEDESGGGDGAYGLFDVEGDPVAIGEAIAEELSTADMTRGPEWAYIADGDSELYLVLKIKFANHFVEFKEEE